MIEIELNNVKKNYGLKNVLDGFNMQIKTGDRIALIGINGTGKSTVLKIINGTESVDEGTISIRKNVEISMLNQIYENEKSNVKVHEFIKRSFKEFFDLEEKMRQLESQMNTVISSDKLNLILKRYGNLQQEYISKGGYELEEKFNKICSGFKFTIDFLNQEYNLLSGGEKTKVNLAAILLKNPDILLLDEPTNHLDINTLEWLEEFLINYKGTILMVSHDRFFLDKVATKIVLLENGKEQIYFGNYSYYLEEDERRTLAQFEVYKSQQKQIEKMKESIATLRKFGDLAKNEMFFKRAKSIEKRLEKMEVIDTVDLNKKKLDLKLDVIERSGKDVIIIENLTKQYANKKIFHDCNLGIYYEEKVALIGENGTGKSTLIKLILGKDNKYSGTIKIGSAVKIGYIPQEIIFEDENETILNFIMKSYKGSLTEARTYLAKYSFRGNDVFKKVKSLSGGEKVRIKLLELLQKDINFLILDEPTNHIDIDTREVLEESLNQYKGTVLFVSHDRYFINKVANRVVEIDNYKFNSYSGNYNFYEYVKK